MSQRSTNEPTDLVVTPLSDISKSDAPMIFDLGLRSKKQVKRLRKGDGKLMDGIVNVIDELKKNEKIAAHIQPIVIIVRERREKGIAALFKS